MWIVQFRDPSGSEQSAENCFYLEAQDLFAQAVKVRPDDGQLLLGLAIASYYAGDLDIAGAAIQRARDVSADDTPLLRPSALISAALGDDEQARRFVEQYQLTPVHPLQVTQLQRRLQDLQRAYAQVDTRQGKRTRLPAIAKPPVAATTGTATTETGQRQIIIDTVIIRSLRDLERDRGVNLLDGLQLQFSSNHTAVDTAGVLTRTFTRSLGIPEITYSLNIFNTRDERLEIIARPSLLATEEQPSSLFLGELFVAPLQGTFEAEALSQRVGVTLNVTPTFLSDDEFLLKVFIGDSEFTPGNIPGTFREALLITIADTSVTARIRLGQTLLLSGLSEHRFLHTENKVPILGDIPLIQTFFKRKETREAVSETMILLTPRLAIDTAKPPASAPTPAGRSGSQRVEDLRQSYLQPFTPATNYEALLYHMSANDYFEQFRKGDLQLDILKGPQGLKRLWDEVIAYVYF